ncbi:MAG TPA: Gfo/Idh/MocA family oxidoreductase [Pyrinomonadaceae bacterium]|nr:Gfo/Idh/MocA family oxidoreductase [Pyrinomonadaceae bacterium]
MRKLKWGLIGCGDIARRRVAPAMRDLADCELVAVSRARFSEAESFAREFGARKWFEDWRELVADSEIDAIYIATPVRPHPAQAIAAAAAAKHVLCEKPMAMNVAECDEMIAACRDNGVKLGVAYYRRFYPIVERVKDILESGEIGTPVIAQINAFEWFDPPPDHSRRWLLSKEESGGGPMMDFGCHRVEVLTNLLGKIRATRGFNSNVLFRREVEDTSVALFEFESGARGVLSVTHASREPQDTLDIFGSEGSIHVGVLNNGEARIRVGDADRVENHPPHANMHLPLIADFTQAVLNNREPAVNGRAGREVARIIEEIYSQTGDRSQESEDRSGVVN